MTEIQYAYFEDNKTAFMLTPGPNLNSELKQLNSWQIHLISMKLSR